MTFTPLERAFIAMMVVAVVKELRAEAAAEKAEPQGRGSETLPRRAG
jgi:hypothetical protein